MGGGKGGKGKEKKQLVDFVAFCKFYCLAPHGLTGDFGEGAETPLAQGLCQSGAVSHGGRCFQTARLCLAGGADSSCSPCVKGQEVYP